MFTLIATMLAILAFTRRRSVFAESAAVATAAAVISAAFDLRLMGLPPRPKDILFYGAGNFVMSWILGFGIAMLVGLIAKRLKGSYK